ncbi:MAG TPA: 30S ribosomal protein S27ae [Candidatus Thalassarchaeaceae archaeon]|jgi:small subunit ribosomal protein S27Ae|nr:30S ribosomal protein S27ae [Candidatus Thalassarchaeaceae archaeon]HJL60021.1 30S ribosomal protein S27ae [Candidatus Thalassarchaeaceae archaeon]HJM19857.1 30S ribosomal protein S27ae [Candidatus Thalassarchaeaceae archaeon]|tara:strand:+ start:638 stop:865 length:228 start_codon:yes stop_codon:yes gene_type:complete
MSKRSSLYTVDNGKLVRKNEACPRCGPGVFMAKHSNRTTCGRCGWDASKSQSPPEPVVTETPAAEPVAEESTEEE